jgi:hypothetical protein
LRSYNICYRISVVKSSQGFRNLERWCKKRVIRVDDKIRTFEENSVWTLLHYLSPLIRKCFLNCGGDIALRNLSTAVSCTIGPREALRIGVDPLPATLGEDGRTNEFECSDRSDPTSCCSSGRPLRSASQEHAMPNDLLQRASESGCKALWRAPGSIFYALASRVALWSGNEPIAYAAGAG